MTEIQLQTYNIKASIGMDESSSSSLVSSRPDSPSDYNITDRDSRIRWSLSKLTAGSSQRCYGSTRTDHNFSDSKLISHRLERGDTLQGLAVKYGVTVSLGLANNGQRLHFDLLFLA